MCIATRVSGGVAAIRVQLDDGAVAPGDRGWKFIGCAVAAGNGKDDTRQRQLSPSKRNSTQYGLKSMHGCSRHAEFAGRMWGSLYHGDFCFWVTFWAALMALTLIFRIVTSGPIGPLYKTRPPWCRG